MGVTVQVRNLDPGVQQTLKERAIREGVSLSEYLRRRLTEIAERERIDERWQAAVDDYERERAEARKNRRPLPRETAPLTSAEIVAAIHAGRGD